jgi:transcriptional regulator with XRE-family HTH domain
MAKLVVTPAHVRAARSVLGWNQNDLASAANISRETVADFESGKRVPIANNFAAIIRALEDAGAEFTVGEDDAETAWGVAWRARRGDRQPMIGLHSLRRVGPISFREAGLARLERAFDRVKVSLKDVKGSTIHGDKDTAGMLDVLRTRIHTIVDDREAERLLENIAYAIEDAFDLGRIAGEDKALKDRGGG